jgi:molybdate transport system substrate-binding protein
VSPVGGIAARALVVAVLVVGGAGCGGSERPIVLAAASLRAAGIEDATGARVSYASSGVVAQQVRRGADADVVVVADPAVMDGLRTDGLTGDATVVARNRLAILVPAGRSVPGLAELASPGARIAIGGAG